MYVCQNGSEEMAHWVKALAALKEDTSQFPAPGILMAANNHL